MNPPAGQEKTRILVVDDEQGWRDLFAWELSSKGYGVTVADSGPDAIKRASRETFDLVITDIKMPGMDGVDAFKAIRKMQPLVKVILMTGYALEDRVREGLDSKASTFIRKPFDIDLMHHTIEKTLGTA